MISNFTKLIDLYSIISKTNQLTAYSMVAKK